MLKYGTKIWWQRVEICVPEILVKCSLCEDVIRIRMQTSDKRLALLLFILCLCLNTDLLG